MSRSFTVSIYLNFEVFKEYVRFKVTQRLVYDIGLFSCDY